MTPRVSIGMPVRNGEVHLKEALDSLLAQRMGDFELLISDNASTDATADIVFRYAARELRIRNWRQSDDIGAVANFNAVLARAEAPLFVWAAHDDTWHPDFLGDSIAALDRAHDAAMACPTIAHIYDCYTNLVEVAKRPWPDQLVPLFEGAGMSLGYANLIYQVMRRSVLVEAGGFSIWSKAAFAIDVLAVLRVLTFGAMVPVESDWPLFMKRPSVDQDDGTGRREFWDGCVAIIDAAPRFDAATKELLHTVVAGHRV